MFSLSSFFEKIFLVTALSHANRRLSFRLGVPILLFLAGFIFTACNPPEGNTSPSPTSNLSVDEPVSTSTSTGDNETSTVVALASNTVTHTPIPSNTPTPSLTPSPTLFPTPSFTHMGIELVGNAFIDHVPLAAEAGAGWVRYNGVIWSSIEPQEGERNWGQALGLESRALAVSQAGMNLIAIVRHTPGWAQAVPGYYCGAILPEKLEAFGNFMYDLVSRYSQSPYNVKYWELGNEPDIDPAISPYNSPFGCWGDQTLPYYGGEYYAEMLKSVYPKIKEADPESQVLVGGLLLNCDPNDPPILQSGVPQDCLPSRFLEGVLQQGGGDYFDGISFHAYDYYTVSGEHFVNGWQAGPNLGFPVVYYKTLYLRDILSQYGYDNKFLLNTETALLCGRDQGEWFCATDEFNHIKANYVVQSYAVARGENLIANIWYHYRKGWRASGLVASNMQPLPALTAYQFVSQVLQETVPLGRITEFSNVVGYKFIKFTAEGTQEIWILWSSRDVPSIISLSETPSQIFDFLGQPITPTNSFEIPRNTMYLVWTR